MVLVLGTLIFPSDTKHVSEAAFIEFLQGLQEIVGTGYLISHEVIKNVTCKNVINLSRDLLHCCKCQSITKVMPNM